MLHESSDQPQLFLLIYWFSLRGWVVISQVNAEQIARLSQDVLPISGKNTFLSRGQFFRFQRLAVFLGLHVWALVSYSVGDIVSRQQSQNIDLSNDFVRA